jgi:hypothetical protein
MTRPHATLVDILYFTLYSKVTVTAILVFRVPDLPFV